MKIFLTLFVLFFSSSVVADDIVDHQIEQISVGDSLLDYYSITTIGKNIDYISKNNSKDQTFYTVNINDKNLTEYETLQFGLKENDKKFTIYSIAGVQFFKNIPECYEKMDEIVDSISGLLKFTNKTDYGIYPDPSDPSGESLYRTVYFDFEEDQGKGMDHISVGCTDWSKTYEDSYGWHDNLRVTVTTAEFDYWANYLSY